MDKLSKLDAVAKVLEAYGVGVRAGVLTPCIEDENEFRALLGIKQAPAAVVESWKAQGGTRAPVTLQRPKDLQEDVGTTAQPTKDENADQSQDAAT